MNVTIEANNVVSMAAARELYEEKMEELVGGEKYEEYNIHLIILGCFRPYMNIEDIEKRHLHFAELALEEFDSMKKMGGEEYSSKYREQLMEEIEETLSQYEVMVE